METLIRQELLKYFRVSLNTIKSLTLMTSNLNFKWWYVYLSLANYHSEHVKHTVASVGLICIQ